MFTSQEFLSKQERFISFDGKCEPQIYCPNIIRNQKYSAIFLIPIVLFHQFMFFSNLFFLTISLSQFIPELKVGFMFTYIAPLVVVLGITIIKEAFDDYFRHGWL